MTWTVGLTGGIGSGKSAVSDRFAALGVDVVDTDVIAHELTAAGGGAIAAIGATFGPGFVGADGALDRPRMRAAVFSDPSERKRLEAILHPMIRGESDRRIKAAGSAYAVLAIPLLVESGIDRERIHRVLVIDCPEDTQVARVMRRSRLAEDEVRRIIAAQASRDRRLAAADDVIDNSGTLAELDLKVDALHRRYLEMALLA